MIGLAMLALGQSASPPSEADIVVIARKMRLIEVDIKAPKRAGKLVLERCRVTRPSGYAELDAIPCGAAEECIADNPTTRRLLEQCVDQRSQGKLDAIVSRWRTARGGRQ